MEKKLNRTARWGGVVQTIARYAAQLAVGGVFLFSGFVKAVDPYGTSYKLIDYFVAFDWLWLTPFATLLGFLLAAVEFVLGAQLLLGVARKRTTHILLLFMGVMTPLTLYLAIANPVSDCGCFGDALILTNWQTFWKNVLLLLGIIYLAKEHPRVKYHYHRELAWMVNLFILLYPLTLSWIAYIHQPILDFRPYKTGTDLVAAMTIPEDAPRDEYETRLIYEKEGVQQEFTLQDYPANDTTWHWVETQNKLVKEGYRPAITDFAIIDAWGDDIAPELLADTTYTFLLLSSNLDNASDRHLEKINALYDYALDCGYPFLGVTGSDSLAIQQWYDNTGAEYPFYYMDETTLKTIARANPTVVLLKEGTILWKRATSLLPEDAQLQKPLEQLPLGEKEPYQPNKVLLVCIAAFVAPLFLLYLMQLITSLLRQLGRRKRRETSDDNKETNETE